MNAQIQHTLAMLQSRWYRGRRAFDARLLSERRLLVVAAACVVWFTLDAVWVTPSYERLQAALKRKQAIDTVHAATKAQSDRRVAELTAKQKEARQEIDHTRALVKKSAEELAKVQSTLAPARQMRQLLEGLLAKQGQLKLKAMKTLSPKEVASDKASAQGTGMALFSHGMEITVEGSYTDLLAWLGSMEQLPQRLLWDDLKLSADEQSRLTLTVSVHTFSPDRDALEIAP